MPKKKKQKDPEALTQTEVEKLVKDLQQFEDGFYLALAGTDRFDIIPTTTETGRTLTKEQLSLIKQECLRLGVKLIYRIEKDKAILLVNPETLKVGYLTEGTVH